MGKFTVTHEIHCDAPTFWKVFFDKEFNQQLFTKELGFPEYQVIEQSETDATIRRKVTGVPKMDMPGPVMKLLGSNFRYTEEGTLDRAKGIWTWKMIPSVMADKLRQEGTLRVESIGDNKVRRIAELTNDAKIFGLGGLIESSGEKQLRAGWDASARFMNNYLASKKA